MPFSPPLHRFDIFHKKRYCFKLVEKAKRELSQLQPDCETAVDTVQKFLFGCSFHICPCASSCPRFLTFSPLTVPY